MHRNIYSVPTKSDLDKSPKSRYSPESIILIFRVGRSGIKIKVEADPWQGREPTRSASTALQEASV